MCTTRESLQELLKAGFPFSQVDPTRVDYRPLPLAQSCPSLRQMKPPIAAATPPILSISPDSR